MIKINNKQKALVLFLGLAALLLPTTLRAQAYDKEAAESYNGGAFYELIAYDTYLDELANVLKAVELNRGSASISGGSITNDDFGTSPLGSGLGILIAAGAGYAVVRRKRSRKNTTLLLACLLLLGFTQCKKEQIEPQGGKVSITLNVENGGKATDGARADVTPPSVAFKNGDRILVAYDGTYVGTLTHNGTQFAGTIDATVNGTQPLYFYFVGNKNTGTLTAGSTTSCTVNISDQTGYPALPVISFSASNEAFTGEGSYTASLHNKASLMKFNVTTTSTRTICITGMNNKVTIDFSKVNESGDGLTGDTDQGFSYSVDETDGGLIKLRGGSGSPAEKWAIVLPQAALSEGADGSVYTNEETQRYKANRPALDAISSNQYLSSGVALTLTEDNSTTVDLSKLVHHYRANDGETLIGTLANNYKISIADGAKVTLSGVNINGSGTWTSGNYAGLNCLGDATIVLADGTINTVKGFDDDYPGVHIPNSYTLTIQSTGTLNASSNGYGAGIGAGWYVNCGNIIIKNGTINASGGSYAAGIGGGYEKSCGTIEIQGGHVTATGSNGSAGIGGGYNAPWGDISISGGTVDATGSNSGAGIGAGSISSSSPNTSYGNISISGGTVTAHGGNSAAGIGTGYGQAAWGEYPANPSYCGIITISGGTVEATGGNGGAGIGAGDVGNCGVITITNGTVTATGSHSGAGIGAGRKSTCGNISVQGGQITAYGGTFAAGIGTGHGEETGENPTPSSCGTINISGGTIDATGGDWSAGIGTGNIGNCGNIAITTGVTRVTATKGNGLAECSIGTGYNGSQFSQDSYTVTIGGTLYWDGTNYQNNGYSYLRQSTLTYQP